MADKSRITNAEKVALSKARTENKKFVKEIDDIFRQYYPQQAPSIIARREQTSAEGEKLGEDVYEGRITWGEYNKRRMVMSSRLKQDLATPDKLTSSGATLIPVKQKNSAIAGEALHDSTLPAHGVVHQGGEAAHQREGGFLS